MRAAPTRWDEARIREELRSFLTGRSVWPPYREFQRTGRKALRDAITKHGGAERWATELGMPYVEHRPGYAPIWTEERIRADLHAYLAGQDAWPSRLEFERDGRKALRDAVNRTGGPDRAEPRGRLGAPGCRPPRQLRLELGPDDDRPGRR